MTAALMRKRGNSISLQIAEQLEAEILEMTRIRDIVSGKKELSEFDFSRQTITFDRHTRTSDAQTDIVLQSLTSEVVKKETMAKDISGRRGFNTGNIDHVDLGNMDHVDLGDLGDLLGNHGFGNYNKPDPDLDRDPDGGRPDDHGNPKPYEGPEPFETITVEKSISLDANCHRDRASFDRYVAALDRRMIGNKTK